MRHYVPSLMLDVPKVYDMAQEVKFHHLLSRLYQYC